MTQPQITLGTLALLPNVGRFRELSQSLAVLDAILMPEWQYRYFSFNSHWDEGEMMASARDGCGNDLHAIFLDAGVIVKGYDRDSVLAAYVVSEGKPFPGVLESVPKEFSGFLSEPAFQVEQATFCIWRFEAESTWRSGALDSFPTEALAEELPFLNPFVNDPSVYCDWACDYYEQEVPLAAVRSVCDQVPLSRDLIHAINPEADLEQLREDIKEIGYANAGDCFA